MADMSHSRVEDSGVATEVGGTVMSLRFPTTLNTLSLSPI